jgi:pyruvate,water dikinase
MTGSIPIVLPLKDATDSALCGQKAAALASLFRSGERIPNGIVVTKAAFEAMDENSLRREIGLKLEPLRRPFAVRSSAVAEDLNNASFAGLYQTFLNVSDPEAVLESVLCCLDSASTGRVKAYANAHRIEVTKAGMAVLIQEMVHADAAGVAFSADPRTGDDQAVVSAVRGIGESLVSGEAVADEWIVRDGKAKPVVQPECAVDEFTVLRIAELARRVSTKRGAPQDIEWAISGDELYLLQARPITGLPVKPELKIPAEGSWTKDNVHCPELMTPFGADVYLPTLNHATAIVATECGLLIERLYSISIGGEVYSRVVPLAGKERKAPPWWVLALASRISPRLRSRCRVAEEVISSGKLEAFVSRWEAEWRPAFESEIGKHLEIELRDLDDLALLAELDALVDLLRRGQVMHFRLAIPYAVGVAELVFGCQEMLGWRTDKALELLSGLSPTSSGPAKAMDELASLLSTNANALDVFRQCELDRLRVVAPDVWEALSRYRNKWGWRPFNYEPGSPMLAERSGLLVRQVLDRMEAARRDPDACILRKSRMLEARSKLKDEQCRMRFDALLETATRVYPLREDNVLLTDNLPSGLIRHVLLEAGRRLCRKGQIIGFEDAAWLCEKELRDALCGKAAPDLAQRVTRRRAEYAWVRAHPGPDRLGAPALEAPDLRGLPEGARRINQAVSWGLRQELGTRAAATGETVEGLPVCGGKHTGVVRVILGEFEFERVRPGDVLVCKVTTPAWSPLFAIAGAVVTETGSLLSHAAIVAREHGLPTVIGTGNATRKLRDGDIVTVDGTSGSVMIEKNSNSLGFGNVGTRRLA